ncbi:MAG: 4a-hydroxytetrahydrobiopterin dehydratase [Solirubrobacterales bacterium]
MGRTTYLAGVDIAQGHRDRQCEDPCGSPVRFRHDRAFRRALPGVPAGNPPLSESEAARLSREVPAWERDGTRALTREFQFDGFGGAFGLVARVALLAAAEGHHPRVELELGRASFTTWTHTAAGLTRNDFILAAKIDRIVEA